MRNHREDLARLQFAPSCNPKVYEATGGVEFNFQNHTMGELDLVILDRHNHEVVLVGKDKYCTSLDGALEAGQFKSPKVISMAQEGFVRHGFDVEL